MFTIQNYFKKSACKSERKFSETKALWVYFAFEKCEVIFFHEKCMILWVGQFVLFCTLANTALDIYYKCHARAVVQADYTFWEDTLARGKKRRIAWKWMWKQWLYCLQSFELARGKGYLDLESTNEKIQGLAKPLTISAHRLSLCKWGSFVKKLKCFTHFQERKNRCQKGAWIQAIVWAYLRGDCLAAGESSSHY